MDLSVSMKVRMLDDTLELPSYAHPGDAGLDLRSAESLILEPFERAMVSCGICLEIPQGYAGLVIPRSGLAAKHGISIVNAPGLIDSGYRGEIKVVLVNLDSSQAFEISKGDRIAQLMLVATPHVELSWVSQLEDSVRGVDGFGSSGV